MGNRNNYARCKWCDVPLNISSTKNTFCCEDHKKKYNLFKWGGDGPAAESNIVTLTQALQIAKLLDLGNSYYKWPKSLTEGRWRNLPNTTKKRLTVDGTNFYLVRDGEGHEEITIRGEISCTKETT